VRGFREWRADVRQRKAGKRAAKAKAKGLGPVEATAPAVRDALVADADRTVTGRPGFEAP
jgi:hypothetical protein